MLKTFSLYRKLLTLCRAGHDQGEVWGVNRTQVTMGWTEGSERLCVMAGSRLEAWKRAGSKLAAQ